MFHLMGQFFAQVTFYAELQQVDQRGKQQRHQEFVGVIDHTDGQYPLPAPIVTDLEGDVQYDEAVHQLGDQGRARSTQPYVLFARPFLDLMKHEYIDQLAYQEGGKTAGDDPHALTEYGGEALLHIRHAFCGFAADPEVRVGRGTHGYVEHNEGIQDQDDGGIGNALYGAGAEVFIHDIGQYKFEGPEQYAAGKGIGEAAFAEEAEVRDLQAQKAFQGKEFAADTFSNKSIGDKERG